MKPRFSAFAACAVLVATSLGLAKDARADEKADCVAASEKAQSLRDDRKFLKAREQFLACARDVCPAAVKKDCADQVTEMDKRTPTIVVRAKDKAGQDLVAVRVTSDGEPLTEQLDGRAIPLDPGVHTFHFEAPGNEPMDQKVVLAEGEHARSVTALFGQKDIVPVTPTKRGPPIGAFVVGGVGLVSIAIAPVFYAMGLGQKSDDEAPATGCKNTGGCSSSEIDSIRTKLIVGDVFMFAGAAILATGIVWTIVHYASGNKEASSPPVAMFDVAPTMFGRGAVASTTIRW